MFLVNAKYQTASGSKNITVQLQSRYRAVCAAENSHFEKGK